MKMNFFSDKFYPLILLNTHLYQMSFILSNELINQGLYLVGIYEIHFRFDGLKLFVWVNIIYCFYMIGRSILLFSAFLQG
jgi:hypothetical protein